MKDRFVDCGDENETQTETRALLFCYDQHLMRSSKECCSSHRNCSELLQAKFSKRVEARQRSDPDHVSLSSLLPFRSSTPPFVASTLLILHH